VTPVDLRVQAVGAASSLASDGIPTTALAAYRAAAAFAPTSCGIGWSLIAAIGRVESDHGRFAGAVLHTDGLSTPPVIGIELNGDGTALVRDTDRGRLDGDPVYDRAVGPMQFIPSTWAIYGRTPAGALGNPFRISDAAAAAARYLCAAGGNLSTTAGQARAVFAYNHSDSYVAMVLTLAARYAGTAVPSIPTPTAPPTQPPANPAPPPAVRPATAAATTSRTTTATTSTRTTTAAATTTTATTSATSTTAAAPTTTTGTTTTAPTPTPTPTPTPAPTPTPTPTPTPSPTPSPTPCATPAAPITVDIANETGDAQLATDLAAHLTNAGLVVGTVTTTLHRRVASAIEYAAAQDADARTLAAALDQTPLLAPADVPNLTLVIARIDPSELLTALRTFTGLPCPAPTTPPAG
jgi:hypothetical protein